MSQLSFVEKLLDGENVVMKPLETIVKVVTAPTKLKREAYQYSGRFPIIDQGIEYIAGFTDQIVTPVEKDEYVVFGDHSEHIKYVNFAFVQGADGLKILRPIDVNTKYVYYAFMSCYVKELNYKRHWSSAKETLIPIPCPDNTEKSLEIQSEIVRILDTFTELTTGLTTVLTTELNARKKQYNYYREKLFSFELEEVEWKAFGDIGEFIRGGGLQKKDFTETGVGCIHYGQIYTHYGVYANRTKTFVTEEFAKKARKAKTGDLVIATTSENDEDVCKAVAWLGDDEIAVSSDACIYRHDLIPKYVAYYFQTEQFQKQKRQYITGTKVRRVNADNLAKMLIPIPLLAEQTRIVNVLDKFDTITASINECLPREIELRQKQYEYYRDLLFSFPKPDSEVAA